jgi:hypothetical protein
VLWSGLSPEYPVTTTECPQTLKRNIFFLPGEIETIFGVSVLLFGTGPKISLPPGVKFAPRGELGPQE